MVTEVETLKDLDENGVKGTLNTRFGLSNVAQKSDSTPIGYTNNEYESCYKPKLKFPKKKTMCQ